MIIVGANVITSLSDLTKEARTCNEQITKVRDQLLTSHPWNFAIGRIQISSDASLPANWEDDKWAFSFTLGNDVLRVLELDDHEEPWSQENGKIFANYDPIRIKYIKKETDTTKFSKNFEEAFAYALAGRICYAMTQSASQTLEIKKEAREVVRQARSLDAQENSVESYEIDTWLFGRI